MSRIKSGIVLLLIFSPFHTIFGQSSTAEVDSTFDNYMNQAWDKIRQSENSDSLQNVYSSEFYTYYKENPDTETGGKAFGQAFLMWGNTGKSEFLSEAFQTLDYDSELWRLIILPISSIYARNQELGMSEYYDLLEYLSENLTESKSRSEVLLELLRRKSDQEGSKNEAVELARELVELDAHEFYVRQGLGFLHEFESLNIGQKAPDFEFQTLDGNKISPSSLEGQYVILEFWATWCGPCLPEIPHLKDLYENYQNNGFTIVGISLDRDKDTLMDFIGEREMQWPQIYVEDGWEGELARLFNVSGIPRMYLLDPEGVIIGRDLRGEEMVSKVESLIAQ
ncbi:TlpA family protein disulfide reductase [Gracilimonas sp. Q87]|uniref:TlpA family protein disulfide reductase n=1 Tax=Gracilimonas sp. Q87 TaxID=3384766 RepID=UPI003983F6AA